MEPASLRSLLEPSLGSLLLRPIIANWRLWPTAIASVVVGIVLAAVLVYNTGGTQFAYPYLMLLPVILAGAAFKVPGGVLAGAAGAVLLGPYMPLDVDAGTMQTTENWLVRLGMYIVIGGFTGILRTLADYWYRGVLAHERVDLASGLVSRQMAERMLRDEKAEDALGYRPSHAVAIEFDSFNNIVLALGVRVGTEVIQHLGATLYAMVGGKFLVTRIHGATFCALLPSGKDELARFLETCRTNMPPTFRADGIPLTLLPRFGIASLTEADLEDGMPFRKALIAVRTAQEERRQVLHYHGTLDADARDNLVLLSDFRSDLEQGLCEVHYQPKLDLESGRIFGVEALIRWNCAKRGPVSPSRFVPLVENTMLIDALTRFVIDRAVGTLAAWQANGTDISVAINISPRNLEDEEFVSFLSNVSAAYGVRAEAIELELTETAVTRSLRAIGQGLLQLRNAGFKVAIDDFGTGYSSFTYLKDLPVDWVKLDQSFVRDLPGSGQSREISAATAAMCRRLGYKVIAEGVENAAAARFLEEQGFNAIQGYHLSRPMPADVFETWLAHRKTKVGTVRANSVEAAIGAP